MLRLVVGVLGTIAVLALQRLPAQAQGTTLAEQGASSARYPTKPITVIVPFAAGGPTDVVARLIGAHMSATLGEQLVVENIGGAGGSTGMTRVAGAVADGYTIGIGNNGTQSAAPALYSGLRYDPVDGFAHISVINFTPQAIVAKKATPATDLAGFIAYLQANHTQMTYGHAGIGSVSHVAGTLFNSKFGLKPGLVAYRGVGPALTDLVGGQIDYMVDQSLNVIPQVKSGTIKIYAVAAKDRLATLPDVPTTGESNVDFLFSAWNAMVAPKGTPLAITGRLLESLSLALDDPGLRARFTELGSTVAQGADRGPVAARTLVASEMATIDPLLRASGVKGN